MGLNLLGQGYDALFGGAPTAKKSGAFQNLGGLGGEYSSYLMDRLQTPAADSTQFKLGSEAIREQLSRSAGGARQRLGDTAVAGGWLDSGTVTRGAMDIDRAEIEAFSGALRDLILGLEDRRDRGVLPYLMGGSQESMGVQGMNINSALTQRGQSMSFTSDMLGLYDKAKSYGGSLFA